MPQMDAELRRWPGALTGPMITAQTISQLEAGVTFTTGEIVGPIGTFMILAGIAGVLLAMTLRRIGEPQELRAG
jgi:hypothetical protein